MTSQNLQERILIVDDEDSVRDLLLRYLNGSDAECVTSSNATDAMTQLERQDFSLVISDILMPGISGIDLLRQAKQYQPELGFIMVTGLMDIHTAVDSLHMGAFDFITKPFAPARVRRSVEKALEQRRLTIKNRFYRESLEEEIRKRTFELNETLKEVEESYNITLEAMATALDAREHETQSHSQRVKKYTLTLAQHMGLRHEDLVQMERGALMHDVGKIGISDSILLKPGKLNDDEWREMKKHPQIGYNILQNIEFLAPAAEIVLCHQERWDGMGYPNQLDGEDIPLGARIFAVADTMDAMTSDRPYRKALTFQDVQNEVRRCSGYQFDPGVVEAFLDVPMETWKDIRDSMNTPTGNAE